MKNLICIDSMCLKSPTEFGLPVSLLAREDCLFVSDGLKARNAARLLDEGARVLVISSDDVDSINLAAAIKHDHLNLFVALVVREISGSLQSRKDACRIDELIVVDELESFFRRDNDLKDQILGIDDYEIDENCALEVPEKEIVDSKQSCWTMTVFSGSGGAGKSCVAAVSASLMASLGFKTLLIDSDFQFGDLAAAFRDSNVVNYEDVVSNGRLSDAAKNSFNISSSSIEGELIILAAPKRLEASETACDVLPVLLDYLSACFDCIIINTGSNWSDAHAHLLKFSSACLFLIDQRVSSVRACAHALDLAERLNVSSASFKFALNRCSRKQLISSSDVKATLRCTDVWEFKDGSLEVEEKMCCARVNDLVSQKNALAVSIFNFLKDVCPLSSKDRKLSKGALEKGLS